MASTPQTCQDHQNKASLRTCHSQEEPKEATGRLNLMGHPGHVTKHKL